MEQQPVCLQTLECVVHDQWQAQNAALPSSAGLQQAIAQHEPFAFAQPGSCQNVFSPGVGLLQPPTQQEPSINVLPPMPVGAATSMPSHMEYVVNDQWQVQNASLPPSAGLQQAIAQHEPFAFAQPGPFDHVVSPSSQPNLLANAVGVVQAMHVGAAFSMPSHMECEAIAQHEPAAIAQHVPFDSVAGPGPGLFQPAHPARA